MQEVCLATSNIVKVNLVNMSSSYPSLPKNKEIVFCINCIFFKAALEKMHVLIIQCHLALMNRESCNNYKTSLMQSVNIMEKGRNKESFIKKKKKYFMQK